MSDPETKSRLEREAARIILAYKGADRTARDAALKAWSRGEPDREAAAARALRMWAGMAPKSRKLAHSPKSRRTLALVAAGCLALWVAAPYRADYQAKDSVLAELPIAKGVVVDLDAGSAIDVVEESGKLSIELHFGALFLDVDPALQERVSVLANGVTTTVTGTRFSVAELSGSVRVAVEKGSVSVGIDGESTDGTPRQTVSAGFAWQGTAQRGSLSAADLPDVASWRTGLLSVRNRPLRDVADVLSRRFAGRIFFVDQQLAAARISGSFDLANPLEALRAAVSAQGGRVVTVTPWLAMVMRK